MIKRKRDERTNERRAKEKKKRIQHALGKEK
jgi:hypothetical protein